MNLAHGTPLEDHSFQMHITEMWDAARGGKMSRNGEVCEREGEKLLCFTLGIVSRSIPIHNMAKVEQMRVTRPTVYSGTNK